MHTSGPNPGEARKEGKEGGIKFSIFPTLFSFFFQFQFNFVTNFSIPQKQKRNRRKRWIYVTEKGEDGLEVDIIEEKEVLGWIVDVTEEKKKGLVTHKINKTYERWNEGLAKR